MNGEYCQVNSHRARRAHNQHVAIHKVTVEFQCEGLQYVI